MKRIIEKLFTTEVGKQFFISLGQSTSFSHAGIVTVELVGPLLYITFLKKDKTNTANWHINFFHLIFGTRFLELAIGSTSVCPKCGERPRWSGKRHLCGFCGPLTHVLSIAEYCREGLSNKINPETLYISFLELINNYLGEAPSLKELYICNEHAKLHTDDLVEEHIRRHHRSQALTLSKTTGKSYGVSVEHLASNHKVDHIH